MKKLLIIIFGLVVLAIRIEFIPATFGMIFKYAFQPQAILGGTFGAAIKAAISQGAKRGLFSNEAGMGSTPHAHAQANVKHPHEQGTVAMAGVFLDTFVVLTLVALVIVSTMYVPGGELAESGAALITGITKTTLAQTAFGSVFGAEVGAIFVAICLFFFAFSTILGWNLFAKKQNPAFRLARSLNTDCSLRGRNCSILSANIQPPSKPMVLWSQIAPKVPFIRLALNYKACRLVMVGLFGISKTDAKKDWNPLTVCVNN